MRNVRWWVAAAWLLPVAVLAKEWTVDDDRKQCRYAQFSSIQSAINAAHPGDTIKVCPGLYEESVIVDKRLTLLGSGPEDAKDRRGDPKCEAVVRPASDANGFTLEADRITVDGFTVVALPGNDAYGFATSAAYSGYTIEENAIWGFGFGGIRLQSSNVRRNEISCNDIQGPSTTGGNGVGLFSVINTRVENNRVRRYQIGIYAEGPSNPLPPVPFASHLKIEDNEVRGCGEGGINALFISDADITDNLVARVTQYGILAEGGEKFVVAGNTVRKVSAGVGITLVQAEDSVVKENQVSDVRTVPTDLRHAGISLFLTHGDKVEDNLVSDVEGNGIELVGVNFETRVNENKAHHNSVDGLFVSSEAFNNKLKENTAFKNGAFDAEDDNRTQNKWCENWCRTDSPPGTICFKSDPGCGH